MDYGDDDNHDDVETRLPDAEPHSLCAHMRNVVGSSASARLHTIHSSFRSSTLDDGQFMYVYAARANSRVCTFIVQYSGTASTLLDR